MTGKLSISAMAATAAAFLIGAAAQAASPVQAVPGKTETPRAPVRSHHAAAAPDGAVASLVNVAGLRPGQLVLSGRILADIYAGKITMWDAPQIAHWNPGVALPHATIVVIRQQDASPTNFAFTSFLAAQSEIGRRDGAPASLIGSIGGRGDTGLGDADVATAVRRTENSIGYVDYHFAVSNGLPLTKVITRQGVSAVLAAPAPSAMMMAASAADMVAPVRAEAAANAPTLGKLSFTANPPNVLNQMGKSDGPFGSSKTDDPN